MNFNNSSFLNQLSTVVLGANINMPALRIREQIGLSISLNWTGATAVGSLKLQISNDSVDTPVNWDDLAGTTAAVSGAGSQTWIVSNAFYAWIRVVYTFTSGTGTITNATFTVKGY